MHPFFDATAAFMHHHHHHHVSSPAADDQHQQQHALVIPTSLDSMMLAHYSNNNNSHHNHNHNHNHNHHHRTARTATDSPLLIDTASPVLGLTTTTLGSCFDRRDSAVELSSSSSSYTTTTNSCAPGDVNRLSFDIFAAAAFAPSSASTISEVDIHSGLASPLSPQPQQFHMSEFLSRGWTDLDVTCGPMSSFTAVSPSPSVPFCPLPSASPIARPSTLLAAHADSTSDDCVGLSPEAIEALIAMDEIPEPTVVVSSPPQVVRSMITSVPTAPTTTTSTTLNSSEPEEYDLADEDDDAAVATATHHQFGSDYTTEEMSSAHGDEEEDDDDDEEYREAPSSPESYRSFALSSASTLSSPYLPSGRGGGPIRNSNKRSGGSDRRRNSDPLPYSPPPIMVGALPSISEHTGNGAKSHNLNRRASMSAVPSKTSSVAITADDAASRPLTANLLSLNVVTTTIQIGGRRRKVHHCPFEGCVKTFPRKYNLSSHVLCHTGERPHGCEDCGARFARRHDLQRHRRTLHSIERSHRCDVCGQAFAKLDLLQRHVQAGGH